MRHHARLRTRGENKKKQKKKTTTKKTVGGDRGDKRREGKRVRKKEGRLKGGG